VHLTALGHVLLCYLSFLAIQNQYLHVLGKIYNQTSGVIILVILKIKIISYKDFLK